MPHPDRFELQRRKDDWKRANLPAQGKVYIEVDMRRVKSVHQMRDQLLSDISEILKINKCTQAAEPILQRLEECLVTWSDESGSVTPMAIKPNIDQNQVIPNQNPAE